MSIYRKKENDKGQGLDRICDHCGKPKREHVNKNFDKCNEAAAKKKKEEERKKVDAIEGKHALAHDQTSAHGTAVSYILARR